MTTTENKSDTLTVTIRGGAVALAKMERGSARARTYANLTQAQNAADKHGPGWYVSGRGRVFYVLRES